jgi:hypothetical protein
MAQFNSIKAAFETKNATATAVAAGGGSAGNFVPVGTAFENKPRILYVDNDTDGTVFFSFEPDNTDAESLVASTQFVVLAGEQKEFNFTANATRDQEFCIPAGSILYARGAPSASTSVFVWATAVYGYSNPGTF